MLALVLMQTQMLAVRVPNGVDVALKTGTLELRVASPSQVRVVFIPKGAGAPQPDLAVVPPPRPAKPTPFKLSAGRGTILVRTSRLQVTYDLVADSLVWRDAKGALLLAEPRHARTFAPTEQPGYFSAIERFKMQPGEAFYGLGGHQLPSLDYAGETVQLVQRNMENAFPFLLSSRGYGLLAHSACAQTVSLGGPSGPLPPARLADDAGAPGALTVRYFKGKNFDAPAGEGRDAALRFDPNRPVPGLGATDFSIRWTGTFTPDRTGEYLFSTRADDGARLWVDGRELIDDWAEKPASNASGRIELRAGRRYPIRIEYFQAGGEAEFALAVRPPSVQPVATWSSERLSRLDYTFFYGPSLDAIVRQYRDLTGAAPMFGRWAYGFWQCKERYKTQQELLDVAAEFRRRKIPVDNIVQDWFYWDPHPWGSHEFDLARYPDVAAAIAQLHAMHFHFMISVWAKFAPGSANYRAMDAAGFLFPPLGEAARYYDAFDPAARALYWSQIRDALYAKGVDAWWLDASEPEVDMTRLRDVPTRLGPAADVLDAYPLEHTAGVYAGQRATAPQKRVFILTRSAYPGQQRNAAAVWSGDVPGTWDAFRKAIPGGLDFCLSGMPYWTTDIGGFFSPSNADPAYRELFVRWFQYGAFCPLFRVHGTGTDKEPWRFGPEVENILLKFDVLRYRLLPYIYSLAHRVTADGYTIMRALPMDFPDDPRVRRISDEFMFGPALLIAPVTEPGAVARTVYLPKGAWYDFWTGKRLAGGRTVRASAPLNSMPIFVRAGSIIPVGPPRQYAAELPGAPIEAWIYPGADGAFTLYDDAGDGYGYEKGECATTRLRWNDRRRKFEVGPRTGRYPGMLPPPRIAPRIAPGYGAGEG